jgi:hypothetical protein
LIKAEVSATHLYMAMDSSRAAPGTDLRAFLLALPEEQEAPVNHQARFLFETPVYDTTGGHVIFIPKFL